MDKVRFGIIGLGNMGSEHCRYFPTVENATLAAICDTDQAKLDKFGTNLKLPTFRTYKELIDSGKVDAIIIATPHYFHGEMARYAFSKNIHVLSEKPAAVGVKDARMTNEAAGKVPHLKYGIMFQTRTQAIYRKMRELVADGDLGEISRVTWIATNWFRTWSYYASGGWRATWSGEGGGVLINQNPHYLDVIQWTTNLLPKRVTAIVSLGKTHPIEVEDEVSAILEYPNGAVGHFITTSGEAPGTDRFEIAGDQGKLIAERGKLTFVRNRKGARELCRTSPDSFPKMDAWDIDVPYRSNAPEGHKVITQNFINAILKNEPMIAPGIEGIRGLEIGNAMLMSGMTNKTVELPIDGDKYDQLIKDLAAKHGGKKTLATKEAKVDMAASYAKA